MFCDRCGDYMFSKHSCFLVKYNIPEFMDDEWQQIWTQSNKKAVEKIARDYFLEGVSDLEIIIDDHVSATKYVAEPYMDVMVREL